jgi:hypothetical protein
MNAWRSPGRILGSHAMDQVTNFLGCDAATSLSMGS